MKMIVTAVRAGGWSAGWTTGVLRPPFSSGAGMFALTWSRRRVLFRLLHHRVAGWYHSSIQGGRCHIQMKVIRCQWACDTFPDYERYHDEEWGVPVHDDRVHFEFLILEGAQAGLSWATILKRRSGYRKAFSGFDPRKVARFSPDKIERLLQFDGIIRNRLKVESAVSNAGAFLAVQEEFGSFDEYIWGFVGGRTRVNQRRTLKQVPATTPESDALSRDLKRRGFRFVGSTVMYAHMQACGLVNDHTTDCFRYREIVRDYRQR